MSKPKDEQQDFTISGGKVFVSGTTGQTLTPEDVAHRLLLAILIELRRQNRSRSEK